VIQGAAPAFDLTIARDRAIGILIGNAVVYLVFTRVWPVSIAKRIDKALGALVAQWGKVARAADAATRRALAAGALAQYGALSGDLGLIHYEPSWVRPAPEWIASRRRALAELGAVEGPLFLSAGQAGAAADARLSEVAARMEQDGNAPREASERAGDGEAGSVAPAADGEAARSTGAARSADRDISALLNVIDARFGEIADAARSPNEGDDDRCAPLNRRPG
jgi:multidrug resistance protein MdtO